MWTKILIIEDHDDFRAIVKNHLENENLNAQIMEATSGEIGVLVALREQPDIILMDIRLPGINGIDAASRIKSRVPDCDIIVLTMFETNVFKNVFESDDISGYIGKSELYEELIPAIKKIMKKK